jgi:hypothetical protein
MVTVPIKPIPQANPTPSRIEKVLGHAFPDSEIRFEPNSHSEKVAVYLLWQGFEGQPPIERQKQVGQALRMGLPEEEQDSILLVFPLTPAEEQSIAEDF